MRVSASASVDVMPCLASQGTKKGDTGKRDKQQSYLGHAHMAHQCFEEGDQQIEADGQLCRKAETQ